MFDGLKEKLGRFREDVEESADVEDATDVEDSTSDAGEAQEVLGGNESPPADGPGAESGADTDDPTEDAQQPTNETAASSTTEADTSLTRKAKSLATGKVVIDESDLEDPLWELEMALIESDVEMSVAEELIERIRAELVGETRSVTTGTGSVIDEALREALLDVLDVDGLDFDSYVTAADKPVVVIFTGVNGVGKTTSIAKIAKRLESRGKDVVLANGDTFRAGANQQIEEHADNIDVPIITHEQGGDPAAVIYDAVEYAEANDVDVVLGDTAGRLHTSEGLMDQLAKIDRVVDPDLTLFVDEAVAGQDAINRAREFDDAAAVDGTILTKADADAQGGAAISIAQVTGKPIVFLGTGEDYEDLEQFDPAWLVDQLLGETPG